jgi:hypothetical protein
MDRWDFVKKHFIYLLSQESGYQRWTLLVDYEVMASIKRGQLDVDALQKRGLLEIQDVHEADPYYYEADIRKPRLWSQFYRNCFFAGDEESIFKFCSEHFHAFRSSWVVEQIESWRRESSPESRNKLKKLFNCYKDFRGKRLPELLVEVYKDDLKICQNILSLYRETGKIRKALEVTSKSLNNKTFDDIKKIFYGYIERGRKYDGKKKKYILEKPDPMKCVLSREYLYEFRKTLIRLKYMPASGESYPTHIDPAVDAAFLQTDQIENEYELFRKMRLLHQGVVFRNTEPSLLRDKTEATRRGHLIDIINDMSEQTGRPRTDLKIIYKIFRSLEIIRNNDNEQGDQWIETEDILLNEMGVE